MSTENTWINRMEIHAETSDRIYVVSQLSLVNVERRAAALSLLMSELFRLVERS